MNTTLPAPTFLPIPGCRYPAGWWTDRVMADLAEEKQLAFRALHHTLAHRPRAARVHNCHSCHRAKIAVNVNVCPRCHSQQRKAWC